MSNKKFLIIYLIFMTLTYLWRFALVGASIVGDSLDADADESMEGAEHFLMLTYFLRFTVEGTGGSVSFLMFFSYVVMAYVAYSRGKSIEKGYLVAFPIVGAVFDLILILVPFVPTIMNIITIVKGMPDNKNNNK